MDDDSLFTLNISTNLCQLPVLSFIWATCHMKEHNNQKPQNNEIILVWSLDCFYQKLLSTERKRVRVTTDGRHSPTQMVTPTCSHYDTAGCHDKHLDQSQHSVCALIQFTLRQYLCPPRHGCCQRRYWLRCLLGRWGHRSLLRPPPRAHGRCQKTDHPEWGHCAPLAWSNTVRLNDEHSGRLWPKPWVYGMDVICEKFATWDWRSCTVVRLGFVGAGRASLSCWLSVLEPVATQRYSWKIKAFRH